MGRLRDGLVRVGRLFLPERDAGPPVREQWSSHADHCPRCGQELPSFRPGLARMSAGDWAPPETERDLTARCPFCGTVPAREQAREMLREGRLPFSRSDGRWPGGWDPDEP